MLYNTFINFIFMYVTLHVRRYLIQMFIRVFICLTLDINDSYKVNNERKQTLSYMFVHIGFSYTFWM